MLAPTALVAIALCGCSINLGSLSSEPEHEAPKAAPVAAGDAPAHTTRAEALARSGKTDEALAEFDQAITLDPRLEQFLISRIQRTSHDIGLVLDPGMLFRVTTVTDLLTQNVPLEDVQFLAGHADPRTTQLYDRRRDEISLPDRRTVNPRFFRSEI